MTTYIIEEESVEDYVRRIRKEDCMLREALGLDKPEAKKEIEDQLKDTQTALRNLVVALQAHEKSADLESTHNAVMKAYMEALYVLREPK